MDLRPVAASVRRAAYNAAAANVAGLGIRTLPHRHRLALSLALLAALFWGLLPLALQIVSPVLDTYTITWCRFVVAGGG